MPRKNALCALQLVGIASAGAVCYDISGSPLLPPRPPCGRRFDIYDFEQLFMWIFLGFSAVVLANVLGGGDEDDE